MVSLIKLYHIQTVPYGLWRKHRICSYRAHWEDKVLDLKYCISKPQSTNLTEDSAGRHNKTFGPKAHRT